MIISLTLSLEELRVLHHALRTARLDVIATRMERMSDDTKHLVRNFDNVDLVVTELYEECTK